MLFTAELRQIEEIVATIFHTLLYHRSVGKFDYSRGERLRRGSSYSVGVVGAIDVDCDFIDYTYVRADSQVPVVKRMGMMSLMVAVYIVLLWPFRHSL